MAHILRRRLPLLLGPLVAGVGIHYAWPRLIMNDDGGAVSGNGGAGGMDGALLNAAQVSARLRQHEESATFERGSGILRFDFSQLASNAPCEDEHSEQIVNVPLVTPDDVEQSTDWHFYGIFDGHGGFSTSQKLREALIPRVIGELNKLYEPVTDGAVRRLAPTDPELIDEALRTAFVKLDNEIVNGSVAKLLANPSRAAAVELLPPALSGSCALLAFYDSLSRELRVALAGDSRAVLGVRLRNGQWQAKSLTEDQTGSNEDEVRRIRQEHPQSENDSCVRRGRVLGIYEPTRSFGDGAVKWPRETQRKLASLFFGTPMPSNLLTPPYMTAEPVITRTKLDVDEEPGFVVLASDGLYELLSNEQVVGLVADWLQQRQPAVLDTITNAHGRAAQGSTARGIDRMGRLGSLFFRSKPRRQIGDPVEDVTENKENLKPPIYRQAGAGESGDENADFKPEAHRYSPAVDANAATHLIRNALGGDDHELVSLLLSIPAPMSRNYRDDLTVSVIFFGPQVGGDGSVRQSKL